MGKIEKEKKTVEFMIRYYCRKFHPDTYLCNDCKTLLDYAKLKLDKCRYGDNKKSCKKCTTHCYNKEYREKIRTIMRYTGPRMIYLKPLKLFR